MNFMNIDKNWQKLTIIIEIASKQYFQISRLFAPFAC